MTQTKKQYFLFKVWIKLRALLILLIILAGLLIGLLSLLLPFESLYKERLEHFLADQWGLEVKVDEISGSWRGYGPYFALKNLELIGKQSIQLAEANLSLNVYQLILPGGRTGIDLSINEAELDLIHAGAGAGITLNNEHNEARLSELVDRVLTTGSLRVEDLLFNLADEAGVVILAGLEADLLLEQDENFRALRLLIESGDDQTLNNYEQSIEIKSQGLRRNSLIEDARWYLKFNHFKLNRLKDLVKNINLPEGELDGEIWFELSDGHIFTSSGQLSWTDPKHGFSFDVLLSQQADNVANKEVNENWQALLKFQNIQFQEQELPGFELMLQRNQDLTQVKATDVSITWLSQLLIGTGLSSEFNLDGLEQVSGQINQFQSSFNHLNDSWEESHLEVSGLNAEHPSFNLLNFAGTYTFDGQVGQLLIDSNDGSLAINDVYRGTLNWQQLSAQISVALQENTPSIRINNLWCACEDFNLQLWSDLKLDDDVHMNLTSRLQDVDVASLHKYWPHQVWNEKTISWLDQGLIGGQVKDAFVIVFGDLIHEGFKKGVATFISRAYTKDVDNQFHPEWPRVNGINAVAEFGHDEAHVQIQHAKSMGLVVNEAQVDIDSFDTGVLSVDLMAYSNNNTILEYIRSSPLVENIELVDTIKIGGQQLIDLAFDVGIKSEVQQVFNPQGTVLFKEGQFDTEHFSVDGINGPVKLNGYQLLMSDLPAKLNQADILLNGQILTQSDEGVLIDVDLGGTLNTEYLLDIIQQDIPISGESDWNINIKNLRQGLAMSAKSLLAGVSIDLPAPLAKLAEENKTLEIKCSLPCSDSTVEINYNNEIVSTIDSKSGQYHLTRLQFLNTIKDSSSTADNDDLFGGYIDTLNLDQWMKLLTEKRANQKNVNSEQLDSEHPLTQSKIDKTELPVDQINLTINQLIFMSRIFTDIELLIQRQGEGYVIEIDSEAIKGQLLVDDDLQQKGIVAEFEYLHWVDALEELLVETTDEVASAKIPDIHLWAEHFSYSGIPLGDLRLEVRNVADGIKIEQLNLKSDLATIIISGSWYKSTSGLGQSNFHVVMISERIADFLQAVGFKAPITNAQTLIEMTAQWAGIPSQFNIADIDGDLEIKIGQGQVLDQEQGFGRVLGLFNLTNLPRRLILDFRDVLADGLLFSSMEGHFKITSGVANTDDFMIKASSAKIHIKGDVGFADQSYDQTIVIRPQIGKTFPTIGAIAGGPVGAAAGFLVQGLLGKQLKSKSEIIYHVTGTWDNPLIELIEREQIDQNNDEG